MKKIFQSPIFTATIAFVFLACIFSCSDENFEDAYYTTYTFYSENPDENPNAAKTERKFKIGNQYYSNDLPTKDDDAFSSIKTEKTGYSIDGWKYHADTKESASIPSTISTYSDGIVTSFTATPRKESFYISSWSAITYRIIFDANGGSGYMSEMPLTYDETYSLSENTFTFYGKTFASWNTKADGSGQSFSDGENVTNLTSAKNGTITLYAQWDSNSYSLVLHSNYEDDMTNTYTVVWGESITLSQDFSRPGYRLTGYNTQSDGSGSGYAIGDTFEPTEEGINLYAQWEIETYKIEFDAAGGTGAPASQNFHYGDSVEIPSATPTKSGFTFQSWESSDGNNYSQGEVFTGTQSVVLSASWKPKGNASVAHDYNASISISYTESGIVFSSSVPGRWECDGTTIGENTTTATILYADYAAGTGHTIVFTGISDSTFAFGGVNFTIDE